MDGIRLKKIESLLTEDLSEMFRRFTKENMPGVMISVSKVSVTPDLAAARVRLSMFPVGDKESLLKQLKSMTPQFRGASQSAGTRIFHRRFDRLHRDDRPRTSRRRRKPYKKINSRKCSFLRL